MTRDDLDLHYGYKPQEMILSDVSDTIHADSLALFAPNIEVLLADRGKWGKADYLRNSMQYFFTECLYLTKDFS